MAFDTIIAISFRRLCPTDAVHVSLAMANFIPMTAALGACVMLLGKLPGAAAAGQVVQQYQSQDEAEHLKQAATTFAPQVAEWTMQLCDADRLLFLSLATGVESACEQSLITQQDPVLGIVSDMTESAAESANEANERAMAHVQRRLNVVTDLLETKALRNQVQASLGEEELEKSNQWAEDWIRRKSMQEGGDQELNELDGRHLLRRTGEASPRPKTMVLRRILGPAAGAA
eukprot:s307_g18.t1